MDAGGRLKRNNRLSAVLFYFRFISRCATGFSRPLLRVTNLNCVILLSAGF